MLSLGREIASRFIDDKKFQAHAHFQNVPKILLAQLGHICSPLWTLAYEALVLELLKRFTQGGLADAQLEGQLLFDESFARLNVPVDDRATKSFRRDLRGRGNAKPS